MGVLRVFVNELFYEILISTFMRIIKDYQKNHLFFSFFIKNF